MALDGDIDYGRFDLNELEDALARIDRQRFPINYQRLLFELERRRAEAWANAPATPYALEFTGNAGEYFRIWIVNLALTIVTLGVYSAWAKVRKQRYFYSNTYLNGSAFGYHAEPLRILKGRLIAALFVVGYFIALRTSLRATLIMIGVVLVATPWLVVKSRMFAARVTSWRGIRFDFKPDYLGAYAILLGLLVLGIISLGLLMPRLVRERYRFLVTRSAFGITAFDCNPSVGRFYKTAFGAAGLAIGVALVMIIPVMLIGGLLRLDPGHSPIVAKALSLGSAFLNYAILAPVVLGYSQARNLNEVFNNTTLGKHRLEAKLDASRLIVIYLGNVFAIIGTLGLLTPWAQIRLARYRIQSLALHAAGPLDELAGKPGADIPSAASEELSSFLDLDFGF